MEKNNKKAETWKTSQHLWRSPDCGTPNSTAFFMCTSEKSNEVNHWICNVITANDIMVIGLSVQLHCWKGVRIRRGGGWLRFHLDVTEHEPTQEHGGHEPPTPSLRPPRSASELIVSDMQESLQDWFLFSDEHLRSLLKRRVAIRSHKS